MPRPDMPTHFIRRFALIGLAMLVAWPVHAQPAPTGQPPPNAVSVELEKLSSADDSFLGLPSAILSGPLGLVAGVQRCGNKLRAGREASFAPSRFAD